MKLRWRRLSRPIRISLSLTLLLLFSLAISHGIRLMNRAHGFVMAAHDGDIVKVRAYLDDGMDLDSPDHFYEGATALQLSIYEKAVHGSSVHGDIARLLLERGVAPTLGLHLAVIW